MRKIIFTHFISQYEVRLRLASAQNKTNGRSNYRFWQRKIIPAIYLALLITLVLTISTVMASGGDIASLDFTAAAPQTYNHLTGGGAFNDGDQGEDKDVKEELEGAGFACGDIVTYLQEIKVDASPTDANQTLQLNYTFLAETTGQAGAAHIDVTDVTINYGSVENGDNGTPPNPGAGSFGLDSGINDDRQTIAGGDTGSGSGSTATIISETFDPSGTVPFGTPPAQELLLTITVDDLEAGESVIVRIDARLGCNPNANPTGNLQAKLESAFVIWADGSAVVPPDAVSGGAQTIPFKQINQLQPTLDYGDLPEPTYATSLTNDGARHIITGPYLGDCVDGEADGQATTNALGDNDGPSGYTVNTCSQLGADEDGVTFPTDISSWDNGQTKSIIVAANNNGATQASIGLWIDWTNDGDFLDTNEFYAVENITVNGATPVNFAVTMFDYTANDPIYVRVRIFSSTDTFSRALLVTDVNGAADSGEVEDYLMGSSLLPVTLSYFQATTKGDDISFNWQTASETGNMGFNLYKQTKNGLQRVNEQLILSTEMSSMRASDYSITIDTSGDTFYIEDVNIFGETKRRGPFTLDQAYGRKAAEVPINWASLNSEHELKAVERNEAASRNAQARVQQADLSSSGPLLTLGVSQSGLYRVTHADLLAAGIDLTGISRDDIALVHGVTPLSINVSGSSGFFDANSFIEFYGQAIDTLYSKENIYTLHIDAALAARATEDNSGAVGSPAVSYQESINLGDENKYDVVSPGDSPWFDSRLTAYNNPASKSFNITVDNYVAGAAPVSLTAHLLGLSELPDSPDHHAIVSLGATAVADATFDGLDAYIIDVVLAEGLLQEGANTLQITLPDDTGAAWDVVGVDSYGVTYPRSFVAKADGQLTFTATGTAFQVDGLPGNSVVVYQSDADGSLTQLTNVAVAGSAGNYSASFAGSGIEATYLVYSSDHLLTPILKAARPFTDISSGTADYLMISHADFIAELAPLVTFHEGNGLSVKVIDVADVYTQFGDGTFNPQAIKDYIQFAATNMGIEYVLLVGGDTYDYADNLGLGSISFIPSPYMRTGPIVAFAPVDPLFADVDGDMSPDLKIGRFPVRTSAELTAMVNKTLLYAAADYKETAVFAADIQSERSYTNISAGFADTLPNHWQIDTAYLDEMSVENARSTLIDNINGGVGLTSFVGHSGSSQWTWQGLFDADDAGNLTNVGQPTAVAQWGCWNTYHVSPYYNTLGHQFMQGDSGAAIVLGAATLTSAENENLLGQAFMSKVAAGNMTFGTAVQLAKAEVESSSPGMLDLQLGYSLMGDPALSMAENVPTAVSINLNNNTSTANNSNIAWIIAIAMMLTTVFIIYLRRHQTE